MPGGLRLEHDNVAGAFEDVRDTRDAFRRHPRGLAVDDQRDLHRFEHDTIGTGLRSSLAPFPINSMAAMFLL